MTVSKAIEIAYEVVKLLVAKGFLAGVAFGADDVAVAIKLRDDQLLQVKINDALAERGADWIAANIEKHLLVIN
ncbi:MAG TPA: hypothetical protein VM577_05335 [Anaerovoracaceae bacterium]|nr:hypothetical protein [Anaerovoracaceae bacterium]